MNLAEIIDSQSILPSLRVQNKKQLLQEIAHAAGKLTAIRTLGGHRRFRVSEIKRCLEEMSTER